MSDDCSKLQQQAISAALSCQWQEALGLNQQILEIDPKNTEALNRLGRAFFELGDFSESKKHFQNALEVDPYNQIAQKFIKRIETFSKKGSKNQIKKNGGFAPIHVDSAMFIEEPGKTKLVTLLKVAEPQKLSMLTAGQQAKLVIKNRVLAAVDYNEEYLGVLPDDLSHRLIKLIHGGNKYQALIKTVKVNGLSILIREVYRSSRFRNQPSFLDGLNVNLAYSSDHIVVPSDGDEAMIYDQAEEDESN